VVNVAVTHYPITVIARFNQPYKSKDNYTDWEFAIDRKGEYKKLPITHFPVTVGKNRGRQPLEFELFHGNNRCDASLRRAVTHNVWIYSARTRLNNSTQTASYRSFLATLLATLGIPVGKPHKALFIELKFISKTKAVI
jgi:hypothetical protein